MYLSSTAMVSPGSTLATFIVNTLGRLCSRSEALFPSVFAVSNSRVAFALPNLCDDPHIAHRHRRTQQRVDAERRSARESAALRRFNTCRTVTSAITPLIATSTRVSFKGRRSMAGSPLSTKKHGESVLSAGACSICAAPSRGANRAQMTRRSTPDGSSVNVSCDPIRAIGLP